MFLTKVGLNQAATDEKTLRKKFDLRLREKVLLPKEKTGEIGRNVGFDGHRPAKTRIRAGSLQPTARRASCHSGTALERAVEGMSR